MLVAAAEAPGTCPVCADNMKVQKTVRRHGMTLEHGAFEVRETVHTCGSGCRHPSGVVVTRRAASLTSLIPPGRFVGYDVMVFVGMERYVRHRQREEIRTELKVEHGISLSTGTISGLAADFLSYLRRLHEYKSEPLRRALVNDGGWPLHIDATGENGRGMLLVARTGWRGWVLDSWKVPSERADVLLPHLRSVIGKFGAPCAIMRDLGRAIIPACKELVSELGLDIPVLSCHLHFLSDIGTDLLDSRHSKLRELFRRFKVRFSLRALARELGRKLGADIVEARCGFQTWQSETAYTLPAGDSGIATVRGMAQWVLDFSADAQYQSFPFDRPYLDLYDRCIRVRRAAGVFMHNPPEDRQVRKALERLCRILDPVNTEVPFVQVAEKLRGRAELFDELREALRLTPRTGGRNQTPLTQSISVEDSVAVLQDIKIAVEQFTTSLLQRRPQRGPAQDTRKAFDIVLQHLKNHGDSLWGHVISLPDKAGGRFRLVDRTNNSLEGFFRDMKHAERRRSGRKNLTQDFEYLSADAALAYNLNCPDYVDIVCSSLDGLPYAFAELDAHERRKSLAITPLEKLIPVSPITEIVSTSLPSADRRLVRTETMKQRIETAARRRAPRTATKRSEKRFATAN